MRLHRSVRWLYHCNLSRPLHLLLQRFTQSNRSVRFYDKSYADIIIDLSDDLVEYEEEEEQDDSDIDPDLSSIATHFDDRGHRCERVDAGG